MTGSLRVALLLVIVAVPAVAPTRPDTGVHVLFLGNSLTAANDLPGMVEALAAQSGIGDQVVCRVITKPNFSLQDHWADRNTVMAIRAGTWTHIVFQQGPSSLESSRIELRSLAKSFAREAHGAKVLMFGVWPPRERLAFQKDVTDSYRLAAQDAAGELVPVGEAWRLAWERDPHLPLYGDDAFHPSPLGTYVAALMFFEKLTGRSPAGLRPPRSVSADARTLTIVQDAAHAALR